MYFQYTMNWVCIPLSLSLTHTNMTLRIKIILTHKVRKERPSPRRMGKVTNWAIFVCIAVYALTGLFGSLQYHDETNPNILKNFLKDQSKNGNGSGQNMILLLSFVAMALTIVMAFPLVVFPCRYTVDVMLFHDAEPNWCRHFVLTAVICGCTLLVSLFVPNISVVLQLMGDTTSAFVCFRFTGGVCNSFGQRTRFAM